MTEVNKTVYRMLAEVRYEGTLVHFQLHVSHVVDLCVSKTHVFE
jgi:hypothetical protein